MTWFLLKVSNWVEVITLPDSLQNEISGMHTTLMRRPYYKF